MFRFLLGLLMLVLGILMFAYNWGYVPGLGAPPGVYLIAGGIVMCLFADVGRKP